MARVLVLVVEKVLVNRSGSGDGLAGSGWRLTMLDWLWLRW